MPGLPKFTRYMAVNVEIPEVEVGPVNVARYLLTPVTWTDEERGPLLVDSEGRLIVAVNPETPETEVGPVNVARYKVVPPTFTDGERGPLRVDENGRLYTVLAATTPDPAIHNPKKYEGSVASVGVPVTLDINEDLGKNIGNGYLTCDGPGDLEVDISYDGTTFETDITVKDGEVLNLAGMNVDTIKVDATADGTAYRALVI